MRSTTLIRCDLRLRLWDQWQTVISPTSRGTDVEMVTVIADIEISRAAVAIAYAAVNSRKFLFDFSGWPPLNVW